MPVNPPIAVVIPCFNESRAIGDVVAAARGFVPAVFVVDDGSPDDTIERAEAAGARVLRHPTNRGKGAALRTGLQQACADGFTFAVTMDGDGQHDPTDLPKFLVAAWADDTDLVVGNRLNDATAMPWLRRQVNRWMSRRLSHRAGVPLPDSQCGYRLIRLSVWRELNLHTDRFEVESEMVLAFARASRRIRFLPVRTIYKTEHSKIQPLRDTIRWIRWWWRTS